ncbi:hypothetical protein FOL47_000813 [Perkinsus chesapeaki]|uniref:Uncharacterized protein n=1 Tax=Perkinsus chesapeaki TaxID=330153 RepID=A0A7J6KVE4_PERCH|nr:hypothetical protein FOL47_000813 [Perkinsus chesapeaki]
MRTFGKTREYIEGKRSAKEGYVLGGYIATGKFTMLAMTAFQIGYFNPLTPLMEFATEDGRTKGLAQYARDGGMISATCSGVEGLNLLAYNWKTGQLGPHHYLNALEDKIEGLSEIFERKTVLECTGNLRQEEYCLPVGKSVAKLYEKNKDVRLFQQLYMTGNHQGDQMYGVGWDDNLFEYLKWQDEFYNNLGQRHTTILMSDHGNQWASHKAAANERYSPLAVILSNERFPEDVHQVLSYNELALLTSVDLHNAVLGLINKDLLPVSCRRDSLRCDVSLRNIIETRIPHRTPREMGIPTKASPCSLEWGEESSDVPLNTIQRIVQFVNAQHSPGSPCLDLEVSTSFNPTIRRTTDGSVGTVRLRLQSRKKPSISMLYDVDLINETPQFAEPRETYMGFQACMPTDMSTFNKLTCLCDKLSTF